MWHMQANTMRGRPAANPLSQQLSGALLPPTHCVLQGRSAAHAAAAVTAAVPAEALLPLARNTAVQVGCSAADALVPQAPSQHHRCPDQKPFFRLRAVYLVSTEVAAHLHLLL